MPENESRAPARICPPCDGDCCQGRDCPARPRANCVLMYDSEGNESYVHVDDLRRQALEADQGEPVSAWPFMLASGLGSLILVLIGYAIGWYFSGGRE